MSEPVEIKRVKGKITKVNLDSGWGFITSRDESVKFTRIFFHWSGLLPNTKRFTELKPGDEVEFTPQEVEDKGIRAVKINVVKKENE